MSSPIREVIKTQNVKESLNEFALKNSTSLEECDFKIDNVLTYVKDRSDQTFTLLNEDVNERYSDKEKALNERVAFKQGYVITAQTASKSKIELNHSIDYSEFNSHPKIIISPDSIIPYKKYKPQEIFQLLVRAINKLKILNGIIINVFDQSMIKNLKAFTKHVYAGKFTKKIKIPLFDGIEPEMTRESKLIEWYKEKNRESQVPEVDQGEVIIEFIKPLFGKNGFNFRGEIIDSNTANNKNDLSAKIDSNTIEVVETAIKKLYKSKIQGYVHVADETLFIDNRVEVSKLSRNEDKLATDEGNSIEVRVSQNDTNKDSVGEGVELISQSINVSGHVGAKSTLEAVNLQIDGATHHSSKQFAKFATINRHKGNLRCHKAKIKLLEGGEIHATDVDIEASLGGVVYAKNVKIGHVKSNLKVYASNSISVRLVSGEDNLFKINYKNVSVLTSQLALIERDVLELREELEVAKRHYHSKVDAIKEAIKKLKATKNEIKNSVYKSKISVENPFRGLNNVIFSINDNDELIFKTEAKKYDPFYLVVNEDSIQLHQTNKIIFL